MISEYEGIIIRSINYGESDKILHILVKDYGKVVCMAKGARNLRPGSGKSVELFNYYVFLLYKGKAFYYVNQSSIEEGYFKIREDIEKLSCASYIIELVDYGILEGQENNTILKLLKKTLYILSESQDSKDYRKILYSFMIKFISFIGYKPQTKVCIICNAKISKDRKFKFSLLQGGIICDKCKDIDREAISVNISTIYLMDKLLFMRLEGLEDLKIDDIEERYIRKIIFKYIESHMEKRNFKSLKMLEQLNLI